MKESNTSTVESESSKVFQWLPEFSFEDKGSWVWYHYQAEDLVSVENKVHEKNRFNGHKLSKKITWLLRIRIGYLGSFIRYR